MEQATFLVLGLVSGGITAWVMRGGLTGSMRPETGAVASFIAMILLAVWSFAALGGVTNTTECCTTIETYPELGWVGIALSLSMIASGFKAAFQVIE